MLSIKKRMKSFYLKCVKSMEKKSLLRTETQRSPVLVVMVDPQCLSWLYFSERTEQ